ncbi:MAG TPA: hypothetical protein VH500_00450 [Nitrososphaeraceae archaeon]
MTIKTIKKLEVSGVNSCFEKLKARIVLVDLQHISNTDLIAITITLTNDLKI